MKCQNANSHVTANKEQLWGSAEATGVTRAWPKSCSWDWTIPRTGPGSDCLAREELCRKGSVSPGGQSWVQSSALPSRQQTALQAALAKGGCEVRKGIILPCTALGRASGTPVWSAPGQEMCLRVQWWVARAAAGLAHMTEAEGDGSASPAEGRAQTT